MGFNPLSLLMNWASTASEFQYSRESALNTVWLVA